MSLEELRMIVDAASLSLNGMNLRRSVPAAVPIAWQTAPKASAPAAEDGAQDRRIVSFGKRKGKPFWYANQDEGYVDWCLTHVDEGSCRGVKDLVMPTALMALDDVSAKEGSLLRSSTLAAIERVMVNVG